MLPATRDAVPPLVLDEVPANNNLELLFIVKVPPSEILFHWLVPSSSTEDPLMVRLPLKFSGVWEPGPMITRGLLVLPITIFLKLPE